ncbi:MAG TPA: hypothetical protein VLR92_01295, partial [Blastocatellia bacterium]|nr:hypothetical protein [Blastocatellia bacterium]
MPSSSLCKSSEGSILPLQVEAVENRVDDSIYAPYIYEADHWTGTPPDLDETPFNHVGRPELLPL